MILYPSLNPKSDFCTYPPNFSKGVQKKIKKIPHSQQYGKTWNSELEYDP